MALFNWQGTTRDGNSRTGTMEAKDAAEVEDRLRQLQITPAKVSKKSRDIKISLPSIRRGVPTKTLVVFTRQLATMIDAGLPLVQCLEILVGSEPHQRFREALEGVKGAVESGSTFADALRRHPKVFDDLFVNLVAAGEMGGILDTILNRLATYTEKSMKLRAKVKGALKYPITVLAVSIIISFVLLTKVIPTFGNMFKSMGKTELPAITKFMMQLSDKTIEYLPYILAIGVAAGFAIAKLLKTDAGARWKDKRMLSMPVIGNLVRKAAVAKFTRTLGTLISSGVPILDALEIVARTAGNKVVEEGVLYTRDRIAEGKSIAGPMMETQVFPKMVVQMIGVGESTGAMDVMLGKIADFYEDEVDQAVDGLTAMIEPLIMVLLGGIIGSVMIAMYMPIFSMGDALSS